MLAKTIGDYGGPYVDAEPVVNPQSELASDEGNRVMEDVAGMTQTSKKAALTFTTTNTAAPTTATLVSIETQWGTQSPVVSKTATGRYTVTFAASYNDGLSVAETLAFKRARVDVRSSNVTDNCTARVLTVTANTITLKVESPHATLADLGNSSAAALTVDVEIE